jgi:hydroxymethylglutaryl-CoA lyase
LLSSFSIINYHNFSVSLGDTIGVGNAGSVAALLDEVLRAAPAEQIAVHFHDTYGQALSNVLVSIEVF